MARISVRFKRIYCVEKGKKGKHLSGKGIRDPEKKIFCSRIFALHLIRDKERKRNKPNSMRHTVWHFLLRERQEGRLFPFFFIDIPPPFPVRLFLLSCIKRLLRKKVPLHYNIHVLLLSCISFFLFPPLRFKIKESLTFFRNRFLSLFSNFHKEKKNHVRYKRKRRRKKMFFFL